MCQIDVLYGKSLIIDFLDNILKKRTAIIYLYGVLILQAGNISAPCTCTTARALTNLFILKVLLIS